MIVTTTNDVAGYCVARYLGIVHGVVVRRPQGFLVDLNAQTRECDEARRLVFEQMVANAKQLGADAIVGMRFDAANFGEWGTEVLAYGTAVKLAALDK